MIYRQERAQEIAEFIADHERTIEEQKARMTKSAATSTLYLAGQRIKACEGAVRALRSEVTALTDPHLA
jgi:hypothetical protein